MSDWRHIEELVTPGTVAIDCGANVGVVTDIMARSAARVVAFEPNPFAFAALEQRFRGNHNVVCINAGVWDRAATLPLYFHAQSDEDELHWSTGSSFCREKKNVRPAKWRKVNVIDLCAYIASVRAPISLLKLDIEGFEADVLFSMIRKGTHRLVDRILAETHEKKIPSLREPMDRLRRLIARDKIENIFLDWI